MKKFLLGFAAGAGTVVGVLGLIRCLEDVTWKKLVNEWDESLGYDDEDDDDEFFEDDDFDYDLCSGCECEKCQTPVVTDNETSCDESSDDAVKADENSLETNMD